MSEFYWLQLFAEGSEGEGTGETAPDAGEELRALGVPEEKIRKRAGRMAPRQQAAADAPQAQAAQETARQEQDAAAQTETIPKRMTWEEIMEDPEYNGRMQQVVRDRLRESRGAQDNLRTLEPALELLAERPALRTHRQFQKADEIVGERAALVDQQGNFRNRRAWTALDQVEMQRHGKLAGFHVRPRHLGCRLEGGAVREDAD